MAKFSYEATFALINEMLDKLYNKDGFLLQKKLNVNERSITHRMGNYLQDIVTDKYDVDCEYNRMGEKILNEIKYTDDDYFVKTVCLSEGLVSDTDDNGSKVFPDIIVHNRGTANNFIIIEVKIDWKSNKAEHDYRKLQAYKTDLKYEVALFILLSEKREDVKIIEV